MIKLALKHWIYEHCIDVLFGNIRKNFIPAKLNKKFNFRIGKFYHAIEVNRRHTTGGFTRYYNCHILDVLQGTVCFTYSGFDEYVNGKLEAEGRIELYVEDTQGYRVNLEDIYAAEIWGK